MEIIFKPIGYVKSPFKKLSKIPRQSIYASDIKATIKILDEYIEGINDIKINSYIVVLFHFHESKGYKLLQIARDTNKLRGVFSTRSPYRPNGVGMSIVKVINIDKNSIEFQGVDMIDGTPIIDIKPYVYELSPR